MRDNSVTTSICYKHNLEIGILCKVNHSLLIIRVSIALLIFAVLSFSSRVLLAQDSSNEPLTKFSIDYQQEIKPLLARHCYSCHGPAKKEGGLTLEQHGSALSKHESGEITIVPDHPEKSELIKRITSTEASTQMPPEGARLKPNEIELLSRWIQQGATWKEHWAYEPVKKPPVPDVEEKSWVQNPIDAFILKRLEQGKLKHAPMASRRDLIRRASYDLTGLPPDYEDVEKILKESWPQAYEKLIDRLLDSPHYGERWGRHWLDVVRYAESNSFERDNPKPHVWRYRDYVIKSFNSDKPYNRFLLEQLAGDEIPQAEKESLVATGFYRLGVWDDEPADPELARFDGYDDIVTTIGQGFLGLTMNCARCHDHKVDPITQKDYYSMVAFFRAIKPMQNSGGNIEQVYFDNQKEKQAYLAQVELVKAKRNETQREITKIEEQFKNALLNQTGEKPQNQDLAKLRYRYYRDSWKKLPDFDNLKPEVNEEAPRQIFDIGLASREDNFGFVFEGELIIPENGEYSFFLDSDDGSRLTINKKELLVYDGIHGTGKPVNATIKLEAGRVPVRLDYFQGYFGKGLILSWSGPGFTHRMLSAVPIQKSRTGKVPTVQEMIIQTGHGILGEGTFNRYRQLKQKINDFNEDRIPVRKALCVKEISQNVPETHILLRGSPQAHGMKVEPEFITVLGGGKPDSIQLVKFNDNITSTGRRIELAKWIASEKNYLTTRVIMNRLWQHHFGRGIVRSPNNFGQLGESPTHPELLDWLALELVNNGWVSLKKCTKLIMMSNSYQMSAGSIPENLSKDPNNNLFWRFNMRRLEAEEIRDSVIYASGNFNPEMYGESIYPKLSADVLATQSQPGHNWGKIQFRKSGT